MKKIEERRRYPRFNTHLPVRFQLKNQSSKFGYTSSKDISEGGIRLILNEFLRPKTEILLETIILGRVVNPEAMVVWSQRIPYSDGYQIGLEFSRVDALEKQKLKEYIDYKKES